ncbi:MAG: hypothetical protein P4L36_15140 [Holophaga sp.]|nr:hypothetical protein [Holophaga sp.]
MATDFSALESRSQDLIQELMPFGEVLDRMAEAASRPSCRFPEGIQRYSFLSTMARVLHLRAEVRVHAGLYQGALEDIVTLLRIGRHLQRGPGLPAVIGRMVAETALQPLWEGLQTHAWTPQQLVMLQEALASMDLPGGLRADQSRRREYAQAAQELDAHPWTLMGWTELTPAGFWNRCLFSLLPRGWAYQCLAAEDRSEAQVMAAVGPGRRIVPLRVQDFPRTPSPYLWAGGPYGGGSTLKKLRTATWVQASLDQARVACALERFRLARGVYPGALDEMVPNYLAQVPSDWLTGAPLTYTAKEAGFRLGATGWTDPDVPESKETAKAWKWVSGR